MTDIYQKVDGSKYRNIWVVGDLHGCYTNLMNQLDALKFDAEQDLIISVGDLIDRGSENVECLELLQMPWFRAVRGNHEQMMLDAMLNGGSFSHWMLNGGGWLHRLDDDQDIQLNRSLLPRVAVLPLIIEVNTASQKVVICHADYPSGEYEFGKEIDPEMVIWNRERISNAIDGSLREIKGADLFIFGHTPANRPVKYANQLYIDTGAVFCGNLTLHQIQGAA